MLRNKKRSDSKELGAQLDGLKKQYASSDAKDAATASASSSLRAGFHDV